MDVLTGHEGAGTTVFEIVASGSGFYSLLQAAGAPRGSVLTKCLAFVAVWEIVGIGAWTRPLIAFIALALLPLLWPALTPRRRLDCRYLV